MSCGPTLALLIPAWNAASYLPRLLASAANQTRPFDEVWVYDDGSTDDTAAIAEGFGASVIRGAVNRGCSCAKNALARRVTADWLHFHDADDALMPDFVDRAWRWIEDGRRDVVLFGFEERDNETGALIQTWRFDGAALERDPRAYAIDHQINPFCGLYRREAFLAAGGYDEDPAVLHNEDVAMHIRLAFADLSFSADPSVCVINYRRAGSMSGAQPLKCAQAHYQVLRKTEALPGAAIYARRLSAKLWHVAGILAAHLDFEAADCAVALATRLSPNWIEGSALFRFMAALSPPLALRIRESLIRGLKPALRQGYPHVRLTRA